MYKTRSNPDFSLLPDKEDQALVQLLLIYVHLSFIEYIDASLEAEI